MGSRFGEVGERAPTCMWDDHAPMKSNGQEKGQAMGGCRPKFLNTVDGGLFVHEKHGNWVMRSLMFFIFVKIPILYTSCKCFHYYH